MWLLHGTTRTRAERIVQHGPNINFVEPGGIGNAENFSFTAEGKPTALGDSIAYAQGKAAAFPNESGPVIVAVDVPEEVVRLAVVEYLAAAVEQLSLFAGLVDYDEEAEIGELVNLCGGVVQFDSGVALDRLLAIWGTLVKEIRGVL